MPFQRLLTGSTLPSLEHRAFQILSDSVGSQPESVLYIGKPEYPEHTIRKRWMEYGSSASLRIDTFDGFVTDCYERDQYKGQVTFVDRPLLTRLVELGVENLESGDNPFATDRTFPRSGLVEEAENLFTDLEFSGLLSPEAMRKRLTEEGVGQRAQHVAELADAIETARVEALDGELRETYRTERMSHVSSIDTPLDETIPSIDAVVISGFTMFDVLERELIDRIAETWPTIALLPTQAEGTVGVDAGVTRAVETYDELGFSHTRHTGSAISGSEPRQRLVRNFYRHPDDSPTIDDIDPSSLGLTYAEAETIPDEIRNVARSIREELSTGTQPGKIGVLLTSPTEYADTSREVFDTYGIPFSFESDLQLSETAFGDVIETLCQLSREPRTIDTLLNLLTNPLISATYDESPLNHQELSRVAARSETNSLETVLEHTDDSASAAVNSLLRDVTALATTNLESLSGQLDALLERLGVLAALDGNSTMSPTVRTREKRARESLNRVLETLALTAPVVDPEIGDTIDRLERAAAGVSIGSQSHADNNRVVICGLSEALPREFEQVFLLGMTSTHFPSNPDRMAFTESIYDAHPDFERKDLSIEARYHFGALLCSGASIRMSAPQRSLTGDPYVEADVLTELRRLVDLSEITAESEARPGNQEDVQRAIGNRWAELEGSTAHSLVDNAAEAGTFREDQHGRINTGAECAAARMDPMLTPYDGKLSAEAVASVHEASEREPYSPSRLETYASCGFKYYMRRVLGIEAPDPLTREPDPGTRGSYIHAVLEQYYLSLQSADGEPVDPGGDFGERQEQLLAVAQDQLDNEFDEYPVTAFQDQWLTSVLAGLGTPNDNQYYGPDKAADDGRPVARGLFYRFLEHEFEEPAKTTARPTWFEARIGQPYDAGTPVGDGPAIIDTPEGAVSVHGLIDRVDTVPGTDPTQTVVRDYKTGSSVPGENDALLGLNFQLPLYALMAESALPDIETVGAAYYQVSPPSSVNSRSGQVTSQPMAAYYKSDEVDVPLLRFSHPHFETHAAFRRFVEETTPERLGELVSGITEGRFQPTVLDPSDAGCRYCDYAHVCDVRSEHRQETIEKIDDADLDVYVPPMARGYEVDDVVEVE
jgi:ATP-dependent helicase/nuclease subunit B